MHCGLREVADSCGERAALAALDETIEYTFALRMKPVPVTLRMLKPAQGAQMYLLVQWT